MPRLPTLSVCLWALLIAAAHSGTDSAAWHDTPVTRLEALALLQTLNAELLSHDSATATLEGWCRAHHLADPARITAERAPGPDRAASARQRAELHIGNDEPVRYRHVSLRCGNHILSEAENWYVPGRLTPEMNRALTVTATPFGQVAQPLHFQRHTLDAILLWQPLTTGWEAQPAPASRVAAAAASGALAIPHAVLRHRALLQLSDGTPIAEVIETYTAEVLAFPEPAVR